MNGVRNCPFCGGNAIFAQTGYGTENGGALLRFQIRCHSCGATAPKADGYICLNLSKDGTINVFHDDTDKACEAWNRRGDNG